MTLHHQYYRKTEEILRDIELNRAGFEHASGARRMGYSQEHQELKKELNMARPVKVKKIGGVYHVRFTCWLKIFDAQVYNGTVRSLHRVTQQAGGHEAMGSIDKYTSVPKSNPNYDSWSSSAIQFAKEQA